MLLRKLPQAMLAILLLTGSLQAQELEIYDQEGFSGGYAEGVYGPIGSERLYPYDQQDPWMHGYIQYMPFYGAYKHFRPYNYKHVMPQAQTASGWGMSPRMPYSQQYWHRYHARATMSNGASNAQEALLQYPQPQLFKRRVEKNRAPQDPNPLNYYPEYPRRPYEQELAPPPEAYEPPQNNGFLPYPSPPQTQPQLNTDPYTGVSYQNAPQQPYYGQPQYGTPAPQSVPQQHYGQQPMLMAP